MESDTTKELSFHELDPLKLLRVLDLSANQYVYLCAVFG
jgi:hypothetical protein